MADSGPDLLIFTQRNPPAPEQQAKPKPQPQAQPQPQPEAKAAASAQPGKQEPKEVYCINHPWRKAFAQCEVCKLPYCFVDIIEHKGKYYCLQDIDSVLKYEKPGERRAGVNGISLFASVLVLANSIILAYFTYPQIQFLANNVSKQGFVNFILTLNPLYYSSTTNTAIILLGVIAALAVTRKSELFFSFGFGITFASLFIIVYEYLSNYVYYLLGSSALLIVAVVVIAYSRMSSFNEANQTFATQPVNWPKPGAY